MIISLFKKNDLSTFILMIFIGFLLWMNEFLFLGSAEFESASNSPFYDLLMNFIPKSAIFTKILAFILIVSQALMINQIGQKSKMLRNKKMLPGMIYIILMSLQSQVINLHPAIFANFFLIGSISISVIDTASRRAIIRVFNLGLFISLAGLCFFPAYSLFFAVFFLMDVFSIVKIKGLFAYLIGFATPIFIGANYHFHFGNLGDRITAFLENFNNFGLVMLPSEPQTIFLIAYTALLFLISIVHLSMAQTSATTASLRSGIGNIGIFFVFLAVVFVFSYKQWILSYCLLFVPTSLALTVWLVDQRKKWVAELAMAILLGLIVLEKLL